MATDGRTRPADRVSASPIKGQWIWHRRRLQDFNEMLLARRAFRLNSPARATLAVTADTRYHLYVNGVWVNDGPARSFPDRYSYDEIDITRFLRQGENALAISVEHWGRDSHQSLSVGPGLLAQLEIRKPEGVEFIVTNESWKVIADPAHNPAAPRAAEHFGFEEHHDARHELEGWNTVGFDDSDWESAVVVATREEVPWRNLAPRGIPPLVCEPVNPLRVVSVHQVRPPRLVETIDLRSLFVPPRAPLGLQPHHGMLLTCVRSPRDQEATLFRPIAGATRGVVRINGRAIDVTRDLIPADSLPVSLRRGENLVAVIYDRAEITSTFQLVIDAPDPIEAFNPLGDGVWAFAGPYVLGSTAWEMWMKLRTSGDPLAFRDQFRSLTPGERNAPDAHALTCHQPRLREIAGMNLEPLLSANAETAVLKAGHGDVEIILDFGQEYNMRIGFEIEAPVGVAVEGNVFEEFAGAAPQWIWGTRTSFRYVARHGWQSYQTRHAFGGRYLSLTFRNLTSDVRIRRVWGVFRHYPAEPRGQFRCEDALINKIWDVSRQTMLCCMEDTFVDCPAYEQAYWIGDARNQALYADALFGEHRLTARCLSLAAQSLAYGDFIATRAPTSIVQMIPAWAFLWVVMGWEQYWRTGDAAFLETEVYPGVRRMLNHCLDERLDSTTGLFSIRAWHFFDWIGLDSGHLRVTHSNLFLCESLQAAGRMADALGLNGEATRWREGRQSLLANIHHVLWSEQQRAYVDSLHDDGAPSASVSRPVNALALLYGDVPDDRRADVMAIALGDRHDGVLPFGSPFAVHFLLEFLAREGLYERAFHEMRRDWGGMLERGATTFWECFPNGTMGRGKYPSRSYCHAWSCGPVFVLSRHILGVTGLEPGFRRVSIRPFLPMFTSVNGVVPTIHGDIAISWQCEDDSCLLRIRVPKGMDARFEICDSLVCRSARWRSQNGIEISFDPQEALTLEAGTETEIHLSIESFASANAMSGQNDSDRPEEDVAMLAAEE